MQIVLKLNVIGVMKVTSRIRRKVVLGKRATTTAQMRALRRSPKFVFLTVQMLVIFFYIFSKRRRFIQLHPDILQDAFLLRQYVII